MRGLRISTSCRLLLCAGALALALVAGPVSHAGAAYGHKYTGTSFTVTGTPTAVAVDDVTDDVYVLNTVGEIEKFDESGAPTNFSALGTNVLTAGCGAACREIAVDNSGGVNQGVIYVGSNRFIGATVFLPSGSLAGSVTDSSIGLEKFCGVAVGSSGDLYAAEPFIGTETAIDRFHPEEWATHPSQVPPVVATLAPTDFENPCKLDVNSEGAVYITSGIAANTLTALHRYAASAFGPPGEGNPAAESTEVDPAVRYVAVDRGSDDVYADRVHEGGAQIARFDKAGNLVETFGAAPQLNESSGVAINEGSKTVYATDRTDQDVVVYPSFTTPELSGVSVTAEPEEGRFSGHVALGGGGGITGCKFEYRQEGEAGFASVPCEQALPFEADTDVSASAQGLVDGATYEYRLTAENANIAASSAPRTFKIAPPGIEGTYSTELTGTSAVLNARIDTHDAPTEYVFEYGPTRAYGHSTPIPPGEIAGAQGKVAVSAKATGLELHVGYHFRVVATSPIGTAASEDQTFYYFPPECPNATVRQQTGGDFLPDCRAYELVSPGDQGNIILNPNLPAPPSTYATDPPRFAFSGFAGGINGTEPVIGLGPDTYVATRTSTGWVTTLPGIKGYETNWSGVGGTTADLGLDRFLDFKAGARVNQNFEVIETENIPYIWSADGSFLGHWPVTAAAIPRSSFMNGFVQPSPDFSHMAFSASNVQFAPNGLLEAPGSAYDYDTKEGTIQVISKLPDGENLGEDIRQQASIAEFPSEAERLKFEKEEVIAFPGVANPHEREGGPGVPGNPASANPGVSRDGSHILMSVSSEPYDQFTGYKDMPPVHLYMRVNDAVTYDVSKGGRAQYVGMTADGSKVFFISTEQLTPEDHDTSADLYMWSEATNSLTLLSLGNEGSGNSDSCSGEWVSAVALKAWTTQCDVEPIAINGGQWSDTSIASEAGTIYFYSPEQLDGSKGEAGGQNVYVYRDGAPHYVATGAVTRMDVSPDGKHVAFVSPNQLTPYANEGYAEMYTYSPATERVQCVSCNPTGAPPTGSVEASANGGLFLATDGRVFFYTPDGLVPKDTNKLRDVYEYVEGRPQLITTGTGSHDVTLSYQGNTRSRAGLAGISADGVNVYIDTYETLVPSDENGQFLKYYDVRTDGGFPIAAPKQPCVASDECHGTASSPAAPTGIVSDAELGMDGNVLHRHGAKSAKRHRRKRHGRRARHRGRGRRGAHRAGRRPSNRKGRVARHG